MDLASYPIGNKVPDGHPDGAGEDAHVVDEHGVQHTGIIIHHEIKQSSQEVGDAVMKVSEMEVLIVYDKDDFVVFSP